MAIYVDHTHLGRHVTGLERITLELFSPAALAPLDVVPITAQGTRQMVAKQTFELPMRLAASSSLLLCPGLPPRPRSCCAPAFRRVHCCGHLRHACFLTSTTSSCCRVRPTSIAAPGSIWQ